MKVVTLKNSFHKTQVKVRIPNNEAERAWEFIQETGKSRLNRVRSALCGLQGCKCGVVR